MAVSLSPLEQLRTDWYQTEVAVVVTLLVRNVQPEHLDVQIGERQLSVRVRFPDVGERALTFRLLHAVDAECSSFKVTPAKVEIKLKKVDGVRWPQLERAGDAQPADERLHGAADASAPNSGAEKPLSYPSSKGTDWSAVERDINAEEAKEKLEGDDGLNQLFQKIYGQGSDEVKKAMNKSFMESGGTVLSTNWQEIGAKKTEVKPPDGMEFRKWD